jgi:hypothetical protein
VPLPCVSAVTARLELNGVLRELATGNLAKIARHVTIASCAFYSARDSALSSQEKHRIRMAGWRGRRSTYPVTRTDPTTILRVFLLKRCVCTERLRGLSVVLYPGGAESGIEAPQRYKKLNSSYPRTRSWLRLLPLVACERCALRGYLCRSFVCTAL